MTCIATCLTFSLAALAPLGALPAHAQNSRPTAVPPPPRTIPRTTSAKPQTSPTRQGALLLVLPHAHLPAGQAVNLPAMEAAYGRKSIKIGTLTTLVPRTMAVLSTRLPAPAAVLDSGPGGTLRRLLLTLTPEQWRKIGGDGIALADLNAPQQEQFLKSFPRDLQRRPEFDFAVPETVTLTSEQVRQSRIRINHTLYWTLKSSKSRSLMFGGGRGEPTAWVPAPSPVQVIEMPPLSRGPETVRVFNQELLSTVPAAEKPGELRFDAPVLNPLVKLGGAATVGTLVSRIARATGLELYCDPRYRGLPLVTRGERGRAGDLLSAVCQSVSGTVRKVGPVYIITDDVTGLAARHEALTEWVRDTATLTQEADKEVDRQLRALNPDQYLRFGTGDALTPTDALAARLQNVKPDLASPYTGPGVPVPIFEFSREGQTIIRSAVEQMKNQLTLRKPDLQTEPVDENTVLASRATRMVYEVPGVGAVAAASNPLESQSDFDAFVSRSRHTWPPFNHLLPPQGPPLLTSLETRALIVRADNDTFGQVAQEASRAGITELWIDLPADSPDAIKARLQRAASLARPLGLRLRAVLPLLRQLPGAIPPAPPDKTVRGETSRESANRLLRAPLAANSMNDEDLLVRRARRATREIEREREAGEWLSPTDPATRTRAAQFARAITGVEGISGIVLRDVLPPGYDRVRNRGWDGSELPGDLGYTDTMRVQFLRREGVDPVDLSFKSDQKMFLSQMRFGQVSITSLRLPLFPSDTTRPQSRQGGDTGQTFPTPGLLSRWVQFRRDTGEAALQGLLTSVRASAGNLPVWVYAGTPLLNYDTQREIRIESQDKPRNAGRDVVQIAGDGAGRVDFSHPNDTKAWKAIRARSTFALTGVDFDPYVRGYGSESPERQFTGQMSFLNRSGDPRWHTFNGWVVDLSRQSDAETAALLKLLPSPDASRPQGPSSSQSKTGTNEPVR